MKAILLAFTVIAASIITLEAAATPCGSSNCARPEPAPFQTALPCGGSDYALPEPETVQPA
jgi:hypothetical protein